MTTRKDVERIMNEGWGRPISMDGSIVEVLPLSADAKKMFADALQAIDTLREALEWYGQGNHISACEGAFDVAVEGGGAASEALSATDAMKKE
jgi:hypothetical protein